jgi:hypothetical protein
VLSLAVHFTCLFVLSPGYRLLFFFFCCTHGNSVSL